MEDGGRLISGNITENLPELIKYMSLQFEQNIPEWWVNLKKKKKNQKTQPPHTKGHNSQIKYRINDRENSKV